MQTIQNILGGFISVGTPICLLINLIGVVIGIVFGSLPGLSATMALVLFLPLTYGMKLYPSFALMIGLYIGAMSGSLISAILINIPGQPASIATCWDGAPMAKKGEARKALGIAIFVSFLATMISIAAMMFISPPLARVALKFSSVEYFALGVFSLTLVSGLSGKSLLKGIAACLLGIALSTVGLDSIDITARFTFGLKTLRNGIPLTSVAIGLFAFAELLRSAARPENMIISARLDDKGKKVKGFGFSLAEFTSQIGNFARSSLIGIGIGILPGFGGAVSNIVAYGTAKKASKYPEKFGTGIIDGVVASEASNNASIGGAMVPTLTMGIPGDGVTIILLGAFTMKGLSPGPMLFRTETALVYGIYAAMIIATILMLLVEYYGIKIFVRILNIPLWYILPVVAVFCMVGAYQDRKEMIDIFLCIGGGFLAFIMNKFDYPVAPLTLGYILGPMVENNLRRGMMLTKYSFAKFFTFPIATTIMAVTVLFVVYNIFSGIRTMRKERNSGGTQLGNSDDWKSVTE
jgi:putative tricarboxylic transport membrane protein